MNMRKRYVRIFAFLLCVFLLVTLTACNKTTDPSDDPTSDETSETPKTDTEKLLAAMDAYGTYFDDLFDTFGAKLPTVSDHGTMDLKVTIPVFSIFGESQTDLFDADKPILQATIVQAGDLASCALSTLLYGEQTHMDLYESSKESFLLFPDLLDQAPIRLTEAQVPGGITNADDFFKTLLDALGDTNEASAPYLTVTEDGDTSTYTLRLTPKQIADLLADAGLNIPAIGDSTDTPSDENYLLFDLTTVNGLPTEMHISVYNAEETEAAQEFTLKTSFADGKMQIDMSLTSPDETILALNETVSVAQGSVEIRSTLDIGGLKMTESLRLLLESETSITITGTSEVSIAMEDSAAFTLLLNVTGKISSDGDSHKTELEMSTSGSGLFEFAIRCEISFTPGETTVTMPEGAVDAEQVDLDALRASLAELYPQTFGELIGATDDRTDVDARSYFSDSEDMYVVVTTYGDDTFELSALMNCVDDGKNLTFSYGGESIGSYPYTKNADGSIRCGGMNLLSEPGAEEYGCERILYCESDVYGIWLEIDFYENDTVEIYLCLPFETADGVTKILLPDGTALPFDVILPEDAASPMQIGSLTLQRYVDADSV